MPVLKIKDEFGNWVGVPTVKGDKGEGVIAGGTTAQMLVKKTNADYDTEWVDQPEGAIYTGGTGISVDATTHIITNTAIPDVNKSYVDTQLATKQGNLTAGANITLSGNTISATDTTYSEATTSANGLMSASDKTKLNNIASGAQVNVLEDVKVDGTALGKTGKAVNLVTTNNASATDAAFALRGFVNSSIATNTANYIAYTDPVTQERGPFPSLAALQAYSGTKTNNDYAFVLGTDEHGNTLYQRYKYTGTQASGSWAWEYTLNNSSFTATQWDAISSGITALLVGKLGNIEAGAEVNTIEIVKVDGTALQIDSSDRSVNITGKQDTIDASHKLAASLVSGLATVATSGAYSDLTGQPTKVSDFTNDTGFITSSGSITGNAATATTATNYSAGGGIATALDSKVAKNSDISAGTKCKVTYDAKGLVTAGADLVDTDIPALPISKVTNLQSSLDAKESKGTLTINGTTYQLRISTTDEGQEGYITFVIEG